MRHTRLMRTISALITLLCCLAAISVLGSFDGQLFGRNKHPDFNPVRFEEFMHDAAVFQRKVLGCPLTGYDFAQCAEIKGYVDFKGWQKLTQKAPGVFGQE